MIRYDVHPTAHRSAPAALREPQLMASSDGRGWPGLTVRAYGEPLVTAYWRAPDTPALTLVLAAGASVQMEQRRLESAWHRYQVQPGDLMIRPPGRPLYELRWAVREPRPWQTLHLIVPPEAVARAAAAMGRDPARCAIREQVGFRDPLLGQIARRLGAALHEPDVDPLYVQSARQLLLSHILRYHSAARPLAPERPARLTPQQLRRVAEYVHAHIDQELTLEGLAALLGYSPYHFARLFREATGLSPYQFVLDQRVGRAEALLGDTTTPLIEVALSCGFASQSHLTRVFHRRTGVTPHSYRQLRRGAG